MEILQHIIVLNKCMYYCLFNRASKSVIAMWLWRKYVMWVTIWKHIKRKNLSQAKVYLFTMIGSR